MKKMNKKLLIKALSKMFIGLISIGLLLFVSAGTLNYPGAWRLITLFFVLMLLLGSYLFFKNPELLKKRLKTKESQNDQKIVLLFSFIMFVASFILCGLDFRFELSNVPLWLVIVSIVVFIFAYAGFAIVLKQNDYL